MEEKTHISTAFDRDLEDLNAKMLALGNLAIDQFTAAIELLATQDVEKLEKLIANDDVIDDLEAEIHERSLQIIALRAPRAEDLRIVMVMMRVAAIFERIGDYSRNIANRGKVIGAVDPAIIPSVNIGRTGQVVVGMLADVQNAFHNRDVAQAIDVRDRDVEVDHYHTNFHKEVVARMVDDSDLVPIGVHLLFIAKNIERIGDYATGIAEQLHFLVEGEVPPEERLKADKTSKILGV